MRTPRTLHFSRSPISIHHTPSLSHFGTHPSMIPEKIPSLFSNTYGNPFCNSLCFQIHAGMGGGHPRDVLTFTPYFGQFLPSRDEKPVTATPLEATLTTMPLSVHSKGFTGKLSSLDATLTKNRGEAGAHSSSQMPFSPINSRLPDSLPVPRTCIRRTIGAGEAVRQSLLGPRFCVFPGFRVCKYKP
jgi:hypothetical protein